MIHVRIVLAVLCVLTLATSASAECAWVLIACCWPGFAKVLWFGLTIPQSLLQRADQAIE